MLSVLLFFAVVCLLPSSDGKYIQGMPWPPSSVPSLPLNDIPSSWDWRNVSGVNYLTPTINQHLPVYCGACYAVAQATTLADRMRIARGRAWPDIVLSIQYILNCAPLTSCHGADPELISDYISKYGIVDESCQPYLAVDTLGCSDLHQCGECDDFTGCHPVKDYPRYYLSNYGMFYGSDMEHKMMDAIYREGPIVCEIACPQRFEGWRGWDIFIDQTNSTGFCHSISVVGFGEEGGVPYWIARNSWGTYWGYHGHFRLLRGKNNLGVETLCWWQKPKPDSSWMGDMSENDLYPHIRRKDTVLR